LEKGEKLVRLKKHCRLGIGAALGALLLTAALWTGTFRQAFAAGSIQAENDERIEVLYRFNAPAAGKSGEFDTVDIEGLTRLEIPGEPRLPVRPVRLLVPFGRQVARFEVVPGAKVRVAGTFKIAPAEPPEPLSLAGRIGKTAPNPRVYQQAAPYPGRTHDALGSQRKRGFELVQTVLYPLEYHPASGAVFYYPELLVRLELEPEAAGLREGGGHFRGANRTEIQTLVDNPRSVESYPEDGSVETRSPGPRGLSLPAGDFQYLIITSNALATSDFTKLIAHKKSQGTTAKIVTTDWVYANYPGTRPDGGSDNPTRIRNFIIEAYNGWGTEYVLLGGAATIIPDRKFRLEITNQTPQLIEDIPADMYYGCLDGTFDHDADGRYGEPNDGPEGQEVDLYHEVYVGRAAVENATDVKNFVAKTIAYDKTQDSYLHLVGMVGEALSATSYATKDLEEIRLGSSGYPFSTIGFENSSSAGRFITHHGQDAGINGFPPPLYDTPEKWWSRDELIDWINDGRGPYKGVHILNHLGHCSSSDCLKLSVTQHLSKLKNSRPVFIYSQGCNAGRFDSNDCFAEEITRMKNGAFAAVMNSRYGWTGLSNWYNREFWHGVLAEGVLELGRANAFSKEHRMPGRFNNGPVVRWPYYALTLFGDPQLKLKARDADALFEIDSVSSGRLYAYAEAESGAAPYIDRPHTITSISAGLKNGLLVQTAMEDNKVAADKHLVLRFAREAVVYVAYDKRASVLPAWLGSGWTPVTGEYLATTDAGAGPMKLFKKVVAADADLVLGGNLQGGAAGALSHYLVIVKPAVEIVKVSTNKTYTQAEAVLGAKAYIDRDSTLTAISAGLRYGVVVQTAMDDKHVSSATHLILKLHKAATVFVAYDKRADKLPTWLKTGWTLTGESISTTDGKASPYKVYKKTAAAGAQLTLGGNHQGGDTGSETNYFLIVKM
jgi:hypothetical protein